MLRLWGCFLPSVVLTGQASAPLQEGRVCPTLRPSPLLALVSCLRRVSLSPRSQPLPPVVFMGTRDLLRVTRLTSVTKLRSICSPPKNQYSRGKERLLYSGGQYLGEEADSCPNPVSPLPISEKELKGEFQGFICGRRGYRKDRTGSSDVISKLATWWSD